MRFLKTKKLKNKRPVFGFLCDENLSGYVKMVATSLGTTISSLAEHSMQMGLVQITPLLNDPEAKDALMEHLIRDHALTPNLKKRNSNYDNWFVSKLQDTVIERVIKTRSENPDIQAIAKQTAIILGLGGKSRAEIISTLELIESESRKKS
ncbi:MAG: hypothetical protein GY845_02600 [Planctomycetes bacterium]|nr:hypothetical protein [Planctomycetota bacterium]